MRIFPHLLLLCGVIGLAGCSTNARLIDRGLQATVAQPLVQDSIMREDDTLSFQVLVPKSNNTVRTTAQFEAACSSSRLYFLYLDGAQRVYPMGPGQYSSANALTPELHATLAANPTFIQACAQTSKPDWRRVKTDDKGNWVLLDRNSVSTVNGETRFWGAFDNLVVLNDLPYNAPYAQKREHFAVSCTAGTFKLLAGYDLDARNRVSDGRVDVSPTSQPIAGGNADYQALFAQACGSAQQTAQLEPFKPRHKAPLAITLQSVQPQVLKAIGQLNLEQPSHSLKYLRIQGTSNFKGKTNTANAEKFIGTDGPSGQLSITERGENYESQMLNWRGLIPLVSKASFNRGRGMATSGAATQLSFSGNWENLPIGETVGYTVSSTLLNSVAGAYVDPPITTRCKVERELSASELNPALSGKAKALTCSAEPDEYQRVTHTYYLTDYGYFFQASTDKNRFFYSDYHIDAVE